MERKGAEVEGWFRPSHCAEVGKQQERPWGRGQPERPDKGGHGSGEVERCLGGAVAKILGRSWVRRSCVSRRKGPAAGSGGDAEGTRVGRAAQGKLVLQEERL